MNWKLSWDNVYGLLRNRWFLSMKPSIHGIDIWGWENLRYLNNLNKYDPDQVEDFIICHQILVKDKDNSNSYFHPAFKVLDSSNNEVTGDSKITQNLAKKFSEEGIVPLFKVFSLPNQSSSLHGTTLRKIAQARMEEIRADVNDKRVSVGKILGHINADVEKIDQGDELDSLWSQLASDWATEIRKTIDELIDQKIIATILPADEIGRAASIFENINEGGTRLSNFDLIVAKTAKLGLSISKELKDEISKDIEIPLQLSSQMNWKIENMSAIKDNSISKIMTDQFLNLLSIYIYGEKGNNINEIKVEHIKQKKILQLTSEQISDCYKITFSALVKAFAFLQFRCGVLSVNDVIYKLMVLPIANLFACKPEFWVDKSKLDKIEYWYWLSLFSGRYKDKQNERCIEDVKSLYQWLTEAVENPFNPFDDLVFSKPDYSDEATLLMERSDTPSSAIKNGINQYILSRQPKDFNFTNTDTPTDTNTGTSIRLRAWEIVANRTDLEEHHIIPLASATVETIEQSTKEIRKNKMHILNSPLNLTLISKGANQKIKSITPSTYLSQLSDATLVDHLVSQSMIDKTKEDQSTQDYYKNILHERFNTLKQEVKTKLERLLES